MLTPLKSLTSWRRCVDYRRWVDPSLRSELEKRSDDSRQKLHASLALLPVDASQVDYLFNRLLKATPSELPVLRDALKPHRSTLTPKLWTVLESAKPGDASLLPAASALASYDPDDARWEAVGGKVAQALVSVNPVFLGPWLDALRPVRGKLTAPLAAIFRDKSRPETRTHAGDQHPDRLRQRRSRPARRSADGRRPQGVWGVLPHRPAAGGEDRCLCSRRRSPGSQRYLRATRTQRAIKDRLAERQARAAVALLRMGKAREVMPLLRHSADPRLRSFIVNWLNPLGADPRVIAAELDRLDRNAKPTPAQGQQSWTPSSSIPRPRCGGR